MDDREWANARDLAIGRAVFAVVKDLDAARCHRIADDAFQGRVYETDRRGFAQLMRSIAGVLHEQDNRETAIAKWNTRQEPSR